MKRLFRPALVLLVALGCATDTTAPAPASEPGGPVAYPVGATNLVSLAAVAVLGSTRRDLVSVARSDASVRILPGRAGGTFDAALPFAAGTDPWRATAGDVNGDGIADLLVMGHFENAFHVRLGIGGGEFAPATKYPLRNHGSDLVVADLNGDGFADVVATHDGSGQPLYLNAYLGSTSGELQPVWQLGTTYYTAHGVEAGDFDGDGKTDLAVGLGDNRAAVLVFRGLGTGEFAAPLALPTVSPDPGISDGTSAIAAGDLNGDGLDDIAVVCFDLSNRLVIRLSTGPGFTDPVSVALPSPVRVALADVNGDGKLDAVATNVGDRSVSLVYGNGDGSFQKPVQIAMGLAPASLAVADFDGDGIADIAVADLSDNMIRVRLSSGARD